MLWFFCRDEDFFQVGLLLLIMFVTSDNFQKKFFDYNKILYKLDCLSSPDQKNKCNCAIFERNMLKVSPSESLNHKFEKTVSNQGRNQGGLTSI